MRMNQGRWQTLRLGRGLLFLVPAVLLAAGIWRRARPGPGSGGPDRVPGFRAEPYAAANGVRRWLHVEEPVGEARRRAASGAGSPAVVLFHGGGWTGGGPAELGAYGPLLARRGFVVVLPEYRADATAAVANAQAAVRATRERARDWGIDVSRILVGGGSAGGQVAFFAALDSAERGVPVAGLVLLSAVADTTDCRDGPTRFGRDAGRWSPAMNVTSLLPPTLIVHGDADDITPLRGVLRLEQALQDASVPVDRLTLPGVGHGFYAADVDRSPHLAWVEAMVRWAESRTAMGHGPDIGLQRMGSDASAP